jgi:uncharacterized protein YqfA (UPF0365 family)
MAMADAFRNGQLGIMDFQRIRNIEADTHMRQSIAGSGDLPSGTPSPGV